MDDQRTNIDGGGSENRKPPIRFRLKWLLVAFIPLSVVFTFYFFQSLHRQRIRTAYDRMNSLVFDAHFNANGDCILFARNGNVADAVLMALIPIGTGEANMGNHKVIRLDLRGSKVSEAAIDRFQHSAPNCELVR